MELGSGHKDLLLSSLERRDPLLGCCPLAGIRPPFNTPTACSGGDWLCWACAGSPRTPVPPGLPPWRCCSFAVDDAHAVPIAWLANRNVLICLTLSTLALGLHQRGKLVWALGPMALALCASEAAIGAAAYIVAWELTRGDARPKALLRLAPLVLLIGLWRLLYNQAGYGAQGSALYLDPIRSPLAFATASLERGPILVFRPVAGPPDRDLDAERTLASLGPCRHRLGRSASACSGALWPLLKASRQARFWALGSPGRNPPALRSLPNGPTAALSRFRAPQRSWPFGFKKGAVAPVSCSA